MSKCYGSSDQFTYAEWKSNQMNVMLAAELDRASAERLSAETKRYLDELKHSSMEMDKMTKWSLQRMREEFRYWQDELNSKLNQLKLCIADLMSIDRRLDKAINIVKENSHIVHKCSDARKKRQKIYLTYDPPEKSLCKEIETIEGVLAQYCKTKHEVNDQLRSLRKVRYVIEKDLLEKLSLWDLEMESESISSKKQAIDNKGWNPMCEEPPEACTAHNKKPKMDTTAWLARAKKVFAEGEVQRQNSSTLSSIAAAAIQQAKEELINIKIATDDAFKERINELRDHKYKMEDNLNKIVKQIQEVETTSRQLIEHIEQLNKRMAFGNCKIHNEGRRQCVDNAAAQQSISTECVKMADDIEKLKDNLACVQCSLKSLKRRKVEVEGDLQLCSEALLIDDYECLPLRQGIRYFIY